MNETRLAAAIRRWQSWFRHLPVATKLSIRLVSILMLLGGVAMIALFSETRQARRLRVLAGQDVPLIRTAYEIEINANESVTALLVYLNTFDTLSLDRYLIDRAELGEHLQAYREMTGGARGTGSNRLDSLVLRFDSAAARATAAAQRQRRALRELGEAQATLLARIEREPEFRRPGPTRVSATAAAPLPRTATREHAALTREYLAAQDPATLARIRADSSKLYGMFATGVPASGRGVSQPTAQAWKRYAALASEVVLLQQQKNDHSIEISVVRSALDSLLDAVVQAPVERKIDASISEARTDRRLQLATTLGALLAALALSALAAERLTADVNEPLHELVRVSDMMRAGDLDQVVRIDSSREFNTLGEAFNRMAANLHDSEAQLVMAAARADASNAEKSRFVSDVSHEMRTPLTSLRGSLILLERRAVDPASDTGHKLLQVAIGSTDRLIRMINDRLDLEKIEAARSDDAFRPIDLVEVARDAFREVGGLATARGISLHIEGQSRPVLGEHDRLVQVLVNLLGNSLNLSPSGTSVCVAVGEDERHARVSVSDEGPGVSDSDQHRIFMRFEQASEGETAAGTGLGLAIAREIVEEHRGRIGVESSAGRGATFWFTLPLAEIT